MDVKQSFDALSAKVDELDTTVVADLALILKDVGDLKALALKGIAIQPTAMDALTAKLTATIAALHAASSTVDQADKDANAGQVPPVVVTPPTGGDPGNPVLIG